jgi:hypothetical protein
VAGDLVSQQQEASEVAVEQEHDPDEGAFGKGPDDPAVEGEDALAQGDGDEDEGRDGEGTGTRRLRGEGHAEDQNAAHRGHEGRTDRLVPPEGAEQDRHGSQDPAGPHRRQIMRRVCDEVAGTEDECPAHDAPLQVLLGGHEDD